jgi:4-amino-4-deoxy-L-arabinose transferase-like glycosyltransferase
VLVPIAGVAFSARALYALVFAPDIKGLGDDLYYHLTALQLAEGQGFVDLFGALAGGPVEPTAAHPPLYPLGLAGLVVVGLDAVDTLRLLGVVTGTATVLVIGALADSVAGRRAAIVAAGVAAVWPAFIAADGALMSESLFGLLVASAVLQALRQRDRPSLPGAAALGVLIGAAALTRSEGLLLVPLLAWTVVPGRPVRSFVLVAALLTATALTIAPWVIRNQREFGQLVFSTNEGTTLAGANCDITYSGREIGGFSVECVDPAPRGADAAAVSDYHRDAALDYFQLHQKRALVVIGARILRLWGFYDLEEYTRLEGRPKGLQTAALVTFYPLLAGGLVGAWLLLRRRRFAVLAILMTPIAVSTATAAATYGLGRLRHIVEISLVVIAAAGLGDRLVLRVPARFRVRGSGR